MKIKSVKIIRCFRGVNNTFWVILCVLLLVTSACSHIQISPLANRGQTVGLEADQVVDVMRRAGFSDEEILEHGTRIRNSIAQNGAAQLKKNEMTLAIFVVNKPYLYVSTKRNGSFTYALSSEE